MLVSPILPSEKPFVRNPVRAVVQVFVAVVELEDKERLAPRAVSKRKCERATLRLLSQTRPPLPVPSERAVVVEVNVVAASVIVEVADVLLEAALVREVEASVNVGVEVVADDAT